MAALGRALAEAIGRDFGGLDSIQGLQLRPKVIERLAREHAQALYANHSQMAAKLAEANATGEIGRKEEMKRIFGIEI